MLDPVSEQNMIGLNPILIDKVRAACEEMIAKTGNGFRVACGLRTYSQQAKLYEEGRTQPGKRVTNAPAGFSNHNFGCAVDCYPFIEGDSGAIDLTDPRTVQFTAMVEAMKNQGLSWGGDWHSLCDNPHFQLSNVPVTPTDADRKAFNNGGNKAVWAIYA